MSKNPRYHNGTLRRKHRARFRAMDAPCGICKGRLGAIHYDEPSDSKHPLSFVIDEIKPVSKWRQLVMPPRRLQRKIGIIYKQLIIAVIKQRVIRYPKRTALN